MAATNTEQHASLHQAPLRPPWAIAEWAFKSRCDGCGACVDACREGILCHGADGLPVVDFRFGGCDFCGACVAACTRQALRADKRRLSDAFRFEVVLSPICIAMAGEPCRTCSEFCDSYAIRFQAIGRGRNTPVVSADACSGCGCCVGPCPVNAIQLCRPQLPCGV